MTRQVILARPDMRVNNLVEIFLQNKISCTPVADDDNNLVGIVTKTDILGHIMHIDLDLTLKVALKDILGAHHDGTEIEIASVADLRVDEIMTSNPITAEETTPVKELAAMMIDNAIHRIVIQREGKIVGIVSTLDLLYHVAGKHKNA